MRELHHVDLSLRHQVVEIEFALLILDLAQEFAVFDRHRRQFQRPGFAQIIDVAHAAVVGEYGARPIRAGQEHRARLNVVGGEFDLARPGALRHHDRGGGNGGKCDHAHGEHDGDAALSRSHDCSAKMRTISSFVASTMRTRTARGRGGSAGAVGQASTQTSARLRYCSSNVFTPASTG